MTETQTVANDIKDLRKNIYNSFKAFAYEKITVNNTVKFLTVPDNARYAMMKFTSDATGDSANYLEFKLPVDISNGIPVSGNTVFDVTDTINLVGFNIIQSQAGTHTLHVQYYK